MHKSKNVGTADNATIPSIVNDTKGVFVKIDNKGIQRCNIDHIQGVLESRPLVNTPITLYRESKKSIR